MKLAAFELGQLRGGLGQAQEDLLDLRRAEVEVRVRRERDVLVGNVLDELVGAGTDRRRLASGRLIDRRRIDILVDVLRQNPDQRARAGSAGQEGDIRLFERDAQGRVVDPFEALDLICLRRRRTRRRP